MNIKKIITCSATSSLHEAMNIVVVSSGPKGRDARILQRTSEKYTKMQDDRQHIE